MGFFKKKDTLQVKKPATLKKSNIEKIQDYILSNDKKIKLVLLITAILFVASIFINDWWS